MTTMEVDFSQVAQPRDIHVAFSTALGFPEWYGHNWDAFWDLVSSDYPLPDRLTSRGLDHIDTRDHVHEGLVSYSQYAPMLVSTHWTRPRSAHAMYLV